MVPVENTEGPSLLIQKGREAETDGSCGASGGRHPACAGGKVRPWGWLGWPLEGRAVPVSPSGLCVCGSAGARATRERAGCVEKGTQGLVRRGVTQSCTREDWSLLGTLCVKTWVTFPLLLRWAPSVCFTERNAYVLLSWKGGSDPHLWAPTFFFSFTVASGPCGTSGRCEHRFWKTSLLSRHHTVIGYRNNTTFFFNLCYSVLQAPPFLVPAFLETCLSKWDSLNTFSSPKRTSVVFIALSALA